MDNDNNEQQLDNNDTISTTPSSPTTAYNDIIAVHSFSTSSSAFDSSSRLSTSSSISGWAPPSTSSRARSSSVSSQGSNDSVNLDALIAGGSDINEECPLDLEEGDDLMTVDWSKQQRFLEVSDDEDDNNPVQIQQGQRSRRSTGASFTSGMSYDDRQPDDHWDEPEMAEDETLKGFSQLSMKHSIPAVRGLTSPKQLRAPSSASSRFPDGRNPYDLDADYLDTPSGLTSPSSNNRLSTLSQDSNISNRSSISSIGGSRLQPPGVSRLPGSSAASGLKAPASRLAQPGVRSTGVPQPGSRTGLARPSGLQAPKSGLQAPKSGLQAPNTRLQAPRTASGLQAPRTGSSSSLVKPSATGGRTTPGAAAGSRLVAPGSRVPSKVSSGIAPPSATRSQMAAPGTVKRAGSVGTNNRNSTLLPPSAVASRSASSSTLLARPSTNGSRTLKSPQRTGASTPTQLTSPTRGVPSGRMSSSSSYLVSPTSSHSSTSSLAHARDTVTPLSQRLSNATGTSQLMRPKTAGAGGATRSLSMYGSSSSLLPTSGRTSQQHYHQDEEADYAVLTPPQSPSSKRVMGSGLPRSGMAMPSRLAAPSVSTSRVPRSTSPLSAGYNSGGSSYLSRPHTPTSSLPVSRIPSGLISPRAGRS
ncbi:hypothetical protein EC957_012252 [Mortierella hygrophila]|uniref:Uncharacterized protein n=1 Tax=Mortierella hygrophila TaxID=979708 RepID=A0A9P6F7K7_9FUNG|nr:hypothetical protein EC957_012252 [Mortierella hygrophila]